MAESNIPFSAISRAWRMHHPRAFGADVLGAIVRMTGGDLRLADRLLTQIESVRHVNDTSAVTLEIVEAARGNLVVGQS